MLNVETTITTTSDDIQIDLIQSLEAYSSKSNCSHCSLLINMDEPMVSSRTLLTKKYSDSGKHGIRTK